MDSFLYDRDLRHERVNGKLLQEKTLNYTKQLHVEKFPVSDGWLHAWKICYNISFEKVLDESDRISDSRNDSF